jgi:acyl transferase domain-containing protein/acyl carrier protein
MNKSRPAPTDYRPLMIDALLKLEGTKSELNALKRARNEPIAIIGMACRFPGGADTPGAFWELLRNGVDAISEVPPERWDLDLLYDPDPEAPGKISTRYAGLIDCLKKFDPQFFGISPREALSLDPQQRLLLEVSWEVLENAGIVPERLSGSPTGVFIGICSNDYYLRLAARDPADLDAYLGAGVAHSVAAGRLSYTLGLQGPSFAADTACSSSLLTVHLACQSLRQEECSLALAGGVNLLLSPETSISFSKARMVAPDGRCKTFAAAADGYVRAEGCGMILLKRLRDALADGDSILAVIRGSAVNQDGRTSGLTVPNGPAQQAVIRQALRQAGVEPAQISYVEAHGTGTSLGDPIEVGALADVFGKGRTEPLYIGSVKTNIGHLEAAAGIAGLIKAVLALQHRQIPPHLHCQEPNPRIDWKACPLVVPTKLTPWPSGERPRLAGISSLGFSGTNVHLILEEAPAATEPHSLEIARPGSSAIDNIRLERPLHLLTLSAKTEEALQELVDRYLNHIRNHPQDTLADLAYSSNTGRAQLNCRLGIVAASSQEAAERLADFQKASPSMNLLTRRTEPGHRPKIAFVFAGEGSSCAGMGKELYETQPIFRQAIDRCDEILRHHREHSLTDRLYFVSPAGQRLDQASDRETALFAVEYGLVELWKSWGIQPDLILGDGIGELVGACVAGVFSLEEGLRLVTDRGRPIPAGEIVLAPPRVKLISNRTGNLATPSEMTTAVYWIGQERTTIQFEKGIKTLHRQQCDVILELGPNPILPEMGRTSLQEKASVDVSVLPSLRSGLGDWEQMLRSLAMLHLLGASVDWRGFDRPYVRRRLALPNYPFRRKEYWVERTSFSQRSPPSDGSEGAPRTPLLDLLERGETDELFRRLAASGRFSDEQKKLLPAMLEILMREQQSSEVLPDWLYEIVWKPKPRESKPAAHRRVGPGTWLILADHGGVGEALAALLEEHSQRSLLVRTSDHYHQVDDRTWQVDPANPSDYDRFWAENRLASALPLQGVVHLWGSEVGPENDWTMESLDKAQSLGCGSLLFLVQRLARLPAPPRLWMITRNAIPASDPPSPLNIGQAPLWGMGRVVALEHPQMWKRMIDLDASSQPSDDARAIWDEIQSPDGEDQIALRDGVRLAARLRPGRSAAAKSASVQADASYLITGGLGGLGLHVARWLVARGAQKLVLLGRRGVTPEIALRIREMEKTGAKITVAQADVANAASLRRVFEQISADGPSLRGVIHAAGVLEDGILANQTRSGFSRVLAPKILGTWNLHVLTRELPLDFFIMFSSVTSMIGAPGQGNYAAGNAFMDAFASHRHALGLPALTINWGPWSEAGMAANLAARQQSQLAARGVTTIDPDAGTAALEWLLGQDRTQAGVFSIKWPVFEKEFLNGHRLPLLSELVPREGGVVQPATQPKEWPALWQRLEATPVKARPELILTHVQSEVARILGLEVSELVQSAQGFFAMGMDSLMAVQLKNALESSVGAALPATVAFEYSTCRDLADYLAQVLAPKMAMKEETTVHAADLELAASAAQLKTLSEHEMETLLLKKLETLGS